MDVTKVRLFPRTGRRHQLRIHCLSLGHPIVGDYTYNPTHRDAVNLEKSGEPSTAAVRMMLHAHRLRYVKHCDCSDCFILVLYGP